MCGVALSNFINDNEYFSKLLANQLKFSYIDATDALDIYENISLDASVVLAFLSSSEYQSIAATVTKVGNTLTGLNVATALISTGYKCNQQQFRDALIKGRFNICIYASNLYAGSFMTEVLIPSQCSTWSERRGVYGKYLYKYVECEYPVDFGINTTDIIRCNIIKFE